MRHRAVMWKVVTGHPGQLGVFEDQSGSFDIAWFNGTPENPVLGLPLKSFGIRDIAELWFTAYSQGYENAHDYHTT